MPQRPLRPCQHPGCRELSRTGYCDNHKRPADKVRPSAHQRGYTWQWRKASKDFLAEHPWCAICRKENRSTPAVLVDHITPHKGNMRLFWNRSNWQPACKRCHDIKTATEDGGFGR